MDNLSYQHPVYEGPAQALAALLSRARCALDEGETPRRPLTGCLRALGPILDFIHAEPVLRDEPSLCPESARAILRIAQELEGSADEPLVVTLPLSVAHEEAIRTGVLLLAAYRAAIEKAQAAEPSPAIVAEFGLREPVQVRDGARVAAGLAQFLAAAARHPTLLATAGLSPRQLQGLEVQERVLRAQAVQRRQESTTRGLPTRTAILQLGLEQFFERFESTLVARLWAQPATQLRGLALIPSLGSRPSRRPSSSLPAYQSCQLTDSGRLIF